MKLFKETLSINFLNHTMVTGILSCICVVSAVLIILIKGLNLTIEFTGGTNLNISVSKIAVSEFRLKAQQALKDNLQIVEIQSDSKKSNFLLRMKFIEDEKNIINSLKVLFPDL